MVRRIFKPLNSDSFFLFGARGTGKSTFIEDHYLPTSLWKIDLLHEEIFDRYSRKPSIIENDWAALVVKPEWVFIDEVQRIPALLNHVWKHRFKTGQKSPVYREQGLAIDTGICWIINSDLEFDNGELKSKL